MIRGTVAWLLPAIMCVIPGRSAVPAPIRFEPLTRADGIFPQSIEQSDRPNFGHAIFQDHRGFLWYTSTIGLTRYDGLESVTYPGFPIIARGSTLTPRFLYEDRKGTFWVASAPG